MIEKDCDNCRHYIAYSCTAVRCGWEADELYTAYMQEKERAERFRQALSCDHAYNDGTHRVIWASNHCPKCAEARKEAANDL